MTLIASDLENGIERQEMQPTEVMPEWVGYPEAEKYCGLSHTTLWRYVKSGEIKAARVGRSVRIHLPSLQDFMEKSAAAVVLDSGAAGSHAAIVAREYGIPAVMGTAVGTTVLRDGQLVTVDGGTGRVTFADEDIS